MKKVLIILMMIMILGTSCGNKEKQEELNNVNEEQQYEELPTTDTIEDEYEEIDEYENNEESSYEELPDLSDKNVLIDLLSNINYEKEGSKVDEFHYPGINEAIDVNVDGDEVTFTDPYFDNIPVIGYTPIGTTAREEEKEIDKLIIKFIKGKISDKEVNTIYDYKNYHKGYIYDIIPYRLNELDGFRNRSIEEIQSELNISDLLEMYIEQENGGDLVYENNSYYYD